MAFRRSSAPAADLVGTATSSGFTYLKISYGAAAQSATTRATSWRGRTRPWRARGRPGTRPEPRARSSSNARRGNRARHAATYPSAALLVRPEQEVSGEEEFGAVTLVAGGHGLVVAAQAVHEFRGVAGVGRLPARAEVGDLRERRFDPAGSRPNAPRQGGPGGPRTPAGTVRRPNRSPGTRSGCR
jgi:hypothetical protein